MTTQTSQPTSQPKRIVLAVGRLGPNGIEYTQAQIDPKTGRLQRGHWVKNVTVKKGQVQAS